MVFLWCCGMQERQMALILNHSSLPMATNRRWASARWFPPREKKNHPSARACSTFSIVVRVGIVAVRKFSTSSFVLFVFAHIRRTVPPTELLPCSVNMSISCLSHRSLISRSRYSGGALLQARSYVLSKGFEFFFCNRKKEHPSLYIVMGASFLRNMKNKLPNKNTWVQKAYKILLFSS